MLSLSCFNTLLLTFVAASLIEFQLHLIPHSPTYPLLFATALKWSQYICSGAACVTSEFHKGAAQSYWKYPWCEGRIRRELYQLRLKQQLQPRSFKVSTNPAVPNPFTKRLLVFLLHLMAVCLVLHRTSMYSLIQEN